MISIMMMKECKEALSKLLSGQVPSIHGELVNYQVKKRDLSIDLDNLCLLEERMWRQKSRVKRLQENDRNTTYFHMMASCKRRSNVITSAMVELSEDISVESFKSAIIEVFKRRFESNTSVHVETWDVKFPSLDQGESDMLEALFWKLR